MRRGAQKHRRYVSWLRGLLAPRERLLPALGSRLATHPRLAARVVALLRHLPGRRLPADVVRRLIEPTAMRLEVRAADGFLLRVDSGDGFGRTLAATGEWHLPVSAAFRSLLAPGDVCADVGAHLGYFTLLAAKLVGPTGHVYALEPSPGSFSELIHNLDLNEAVNVTALRVAGGARDGVSWFADHPDGHSLTSSEVRDRRLPDSGGASLKVRVRPLASVVEPAHAGLLRLVKIDVEGYEAEVLRGLEPLLESAARPSIIAEVHPDRARETARTLRELCARYGFDASGLELSRRRPRGALNSFAGKWPEPPFDDLLRDLMVTRAKPHAEPRCTSLTKGIGSAEVRTGMSKDGPPRPFPRGEAGTRTREEGSGLAAGPLHVWSLGFSPAT